MLRGGGGGCLCLKKKTSCCAGGLRLMSLCKGCRREGETEKLEGEGWVFTSRGTVLASPPEWVSEHEVPSFSGLAWKQC